MMVRVDLLESAGGGGIHSSGGGGTSTPLELGNQLANMQWTCEQ